MLRLIKCAVIRLFRGQFAADSYRWRGRILTSAYAHYCYDWDGLPVDETTPEWDCCLCWPEAAQKPKGADTQPKATPTENEDE